MKKMRNFSCHETDDESKNISFFSQKKSNNDGGGGEKFFVQLGGMLPEKKILKGRTSVMMDWLG